MKRTRTKKTILNNSKDTIGIVSLLNNATDIDIYNMIASRTMLSRSEWRLNHLLEGRDPEYYPVPNFDDIIIEIEERIGGNTDIHVEVSDDDGNKLLSIDYPSIRQAFFNHAEMWVEDIISYNGRTGFCYHSEGYCVVVVGKKCTDKYAIDKKK